MLLCGIHSSVLLHLYWFDRVIKKMPILNCKICNSNLYVKPSHLKRGYGKYCSKECASLGRRKGKYINCEICKKEVWKMPKALAHSKSGKYFCSKSCQTHWRNTTYVGPRHGNWKDGRSIHYRNFLIKSNILKICKRCEIEDFRLLSVHHIDENRKNNNIKNLVWLCYNCHFLIHRNKEEKDKFMEALV